MLVRFAAINVGPQLTPQVLAAYCAEHDLVLPEPLRLQLLDQNGGAPADDVVVSVGGREEELQSFFGVGMDDPASEVAWIAGTFEGRLPAGLLAFADDPAGNLFVVDTEVTSNHPVFYWDHEREGESAALTPVASTFDEFLTELVGLLAEPES